ncbi:MAG: hypothetical protein U0Y68_04760 [Blastocatellia bacterium]
MKIQLIPNNQEPELDDIYVDGELLAVQVDKNAGQALVDSFQAGDPFAQIFLVQLKKNQEIALQYATQLIQYHFLDQDNFQSERVAELAIAPMTVTGQVLQRTSRKVLLYVGGIIDERKQAWVATPHNLPIWALNGTVFTAEISEDIKTFEQISDRPWALRNFQFGRFHLTVEFLEQAFFLALEASEKP